MIDRYGTGIVFTRGGGGYYDPRSNTITLDENFTFEQTVLTLVHEANHVDADHSGAGSGRKVMLLSRANFVNDMLTEEATGDLLAAMVAEELAGVIVPAQGAGYSKAALDSFQGKAYLAGRQQGISALLAKQPGASPDAVFRAGVEGARAAMIQEFRNGSLRPSTGASLNYVLYYGTFWDKNRSNRSGPGY